MKIGISCNYNDLGKIYGDNVYLKLKEFGFDAVDFNGLADTENMYYTLSEAESDKLLLHHKALAAEAGIEISQVHGPWRWPPKETTEEGRAVRLLEMKKSIRLASVLGCKRWVVHPIMPFGIEDIGTGNENATWELNCSFMRELIKTAHEYDVTICFENMPMHKFSIATPERILEFVREMNDEKFRICLDTGHVQVFGCDGMKLGEETRRLAGYIECLHVHDNKQERDLHLFPTFGAADWKDFSRALKDIDYKGVFSLETIPPTSLSLPIFEDALRLLMNITREVMGYAGL
ncbi:MAG: sugar phosphate isomerase/epimerase [Clostridia bacterium]|nr:sugar phosphate isomerase/epimerase [Clostridia bacterium]